jgi:signal transduction histidine kinase
MESDERLRLLVELEHSLKTPVLAAYRRAEMALEREQPRREDLVVIRALCAKVYAQLSTFRVFARLAAGEKVEPDLVPLSVSDLQRMLHNAAQDTGALESRRGNRFEFTTEAPDDIAVDVDVNLLEMAVRSILDNATKYSYPETPVRIAISAHKGDQLEISVSNKGLRLRPADLPHVFERGWRSSSAASVRGEGSGIGLWVVDQAMKALDGSVEIHPSDDITTVTLRLPYSENANTDR